MERDTSANPFELYHPPGWVITLCSIVILVVIPYSRHCCTMVAVAVAGVVVVRCSVACNVRALLWGKVSHCELLYHNPAHLNKIYFIFFPL